MLYTIGCWTFLLVLKTQFEVRISRFEISIFEFSSYPTSFFHLFSPLPGFYPPHPFVSHAFSLRVELGDDGVSEEAPSILFRHTLSLLLPFIIPLYSGWYAALLLQNLQTNWSDVQVPHIWDLSLVPVCLPTTPFFKQVQSNFDCPKSWGPF